MSRSLRGIRGFRGKIRYLIPSQRVNFSEARHRKICHKGTQGAQRSCRLVFSLCALRSIVAIVTYYRLVSLNCREALFVSPDEYDIPTVQIHRLSPKLLCSQSSSRVTFPNDPRGAGGTSPATSYGAICTNPSFVETITGLRVFRTFRVTRPKLARAADAFNVRMSMTYFWSPAGSR